MGADIYLDSIYHPARAKALPLFEKAVDARNKYCLDTYGRGGRVPDDDETYKKLQAAVTKAYSGLHPKGGYFRDSYNESSLFWVLGLSWWQLAGELCREVDERTVLPIDGARSLIVRIEALPVTDERFKRWEEKARASGWTFKSPNSSPLSEWKRDFVRRRAEFLTMLRTSIHLNEPLHWSV